MDKLSYLRHPSATAIPASSSSRPSGSISASLSTSATSRIWYRRILRDKQGPLGSTLASNDLPARPRNLHRFKFINLPIGSADEAVDCGKAQGQSRRVLLSGRRGESDCCKDSPYLSFNCPLMAFQFVRNSKRHFYSYLITKRPVSQRRTQKCVQTNWERVSATLSSLNARKRIVVEALHHELASRSIR